MTHPPNMAYYGKRTYKKKTYRKKRTYRKKPQSWGAAAVSAIGGIALKILKNKLGLNTEAKYLDTVMGSTTVTSATWTGLTPSIVIPQGNTTNTRSGNNCRMTHFSQKLTIRSGSSGNAVRVRLVGFVQPRMQSAGAIFAAADIFEDATAQINTPLNMNTNGYRVICDKTFEIAADPNEGSTRQINFNYKPLSHEIEWSSGDTAGLTTQLLRGYIKFFIMTDAAGGAEPTFTAYTRVRFVDN